jgi:murein DD-endopeptidase MepM/ murein hydrolase activator NlpD
MAKPARHSKKRNKRRSKRSMSGAHWAVLFVSTSLFSVIFFLISDIAQATRVSSLQQSGLFGLSTASIRMVNLPLEIPQYFDNNGFDNDGADQESLDKDLAEPTKAKPQKKVATPKMKWQTITVKKGDNLSKLFARMSINSKELHKIVRLGKPTKTLNLISPGEELKFLLIDNKLQEMIYEIDDTQALHITRKGDEFIAKTITTELDKRIAHATGVVQSSLYMASQEAGIPGSLTMELANIFDWDIDFVLDVHTGDRFSIIYEEYYLEGEKISYGHILAAEFVNQGNVYRAVRYTDNNGHADYYTPDGTNMRKAFLRNPVDASRISSRFGKRYHPILNRMRDHKGVDFAAPIGTPVKATGDGKIVHMGRKGGYGNTIIVQHGGKYKTLYAHLNGFAKGLHSGSRVQQGEVIGYVGKTGLATGPHLHYEFRVNGEHRNPLTVKLPGAAPITALQKLDFRLNTQGYITLLDTLSKTAVADANL